MRIKKFNIIRVTSAEYISNDRILTYGFDTEQEALEMARKLRDQDSKPYLTFIVVENVFEITKKETVVTETIENRIAPR